MLIDHLRDIFERDPIRTADADEHRAVIDLLVLGVYADRRVSEDEFLTLEHFAASHQAWSQAGFNVDNYLGMAVAKVRAAVGTPGGDDALLADITRRLVSPGARAEALDTLTMLVRTEGEGMVAAAALLERAHVLLD